MLRSRASSAHVSRADRDLHAQEGVEFLWEGESRPATGDSPRQATEIRVATLDHNDGRQGRDLLPLHGHRPLSQVQWHRDACLPEAGTEIGASRRMQSLRGLRKMRALSRDRKEAAPGVSRPQHRGRRMLCHNCFLEGGELRDGSEEIRAEGGNTLPPPVVEWEGIPAGVAHRTRARF